MVFIYLFLSRVFEGCTYEPWVYAALQRSARVEIHTQRLSREWKGRRLTFSDWEVSGNYLAGRNARSSARLLFVVRATDQLILSNERSATSGAYDPEDQDPRLTGLDKLHFP